MKTKDPAYYESKDARLAYDYKVIARTSNPEEEDIVQSFSIEIAKNPNIYEASVVNKKIYSDPADLNRWVFEYYFHFDRKGHSLAV